MALEGIVAHQLRDNIVKPVLIQTGTYSPAAVNLILGTAAQESQMGRYVRQVGGPALSIYQIEPKTHESLWHDYLRHKPELARRVRRFMVGAEPSNNQLVWNLGYATIMCRVFYLRVPEPLPASDDIDGMARYWKTHYNTSLGKGTVEGFIRNYVRYVLN